MTQKRRERLEKVLAALNGLSEFSAKEVQAKCEGIKPAYVTLTLNQLVREGALTPLEREAHPGNTWYVLHRPLDSQAWIDRQIHGDQVTQIALADRPRERLLKDGVRDLSDGDLLAILIRVGRRGESAVQAGRRIASRHEDDLARLGEASLPDLRSISRAITTSSYSQIMAGIELGRRVAAAKERRRADRITIESREDALAYCQREFARLAADASQEEFYIVTLDVKHKPIRRHRVTLGTLDASLVHPREVFRPAIRDSAAAIILVHNHPSGDPTPSKEDRTVSRKISEAGEVVGIRVLDHIVVAATGAMSAM